MQNVKNLNPAVPLDGDALTRTVVAGNRVMALWRTMIDKTVVMAVALKIFASATTKM
jgi:hypothetical protein